MMWLFYLLAVIGPGVQSYSYCELGADWTDGVCQTGTQQSPIDIVTNSVNTVSIDQGVSLDFQTESILGDATSYSYTVTGSFGNTSSPVEDGIFGESAQFHFHAPSEHTIDGESFDLEMHSVMFSPNTGNPIFVIGILFNVGDANPFIAKIIDAEDGAVNINIEQAFDGNDELVNFYYYQGSLTTPPCDEGLEWFVWSEIQEISQSQLDFFTSRLADDPDFACGNGNNRETQPLLGREVTFYEGSLLLEILIPAFILHLI